MDGQSSTFCTKKIVNISRAGQTDGRTDVGYESAAQLWQHGLFFCIIVGKFKKFNIKKSHNYINIFNSKKV